MSRPDFRAVQYAFAAHLRDPLAHPPPAGMDERRLGVYRDLFYTNIEGFLAGFFPVLRSLYEDGAWHAMVRDFYARHRARSPYFLDIAEEFLRYLEESRGEMPGDPPFLGELAHYEWMELALDVHTAELPASGFDPQGDLLTGAPLLSPLAALASFRWPVHRISPENRPQAPSPVPVCLLVYRDRTDQVRFLELNPVAARLWTLLCGQPGMSGREAALAVAAGLGHAADSNAAEAVVAGAGELLALLRERDIVLGTRVR